MKPEEVISELLRTVAKKAAVGVNLLELEQTAETIIQVMGAESVNKGYHPSWSKTPFPSVICLGVNDIIGHAPPKDYILKDGDLLSIDCGIKINGMCGDAGLTIPIGNISSSDKHLLKYAKGALYEGIKQVKPGVKITQIGQAIEHYANQKGFIVNRRFNGHGIGEQMHQEPIIPHYAIPLEEIKIGKGKYEYKEKDNIPTLYEGQIICIEPYLTRKDAFGYLDDDGWTLRTRDRKKSVFFEEMILVTSVGFEILTTHISEGGGELNE